MRAEAGGSEEKHDDLLCHLYQVVYSDLGFCGCGWPDEGLAAVHELLTVFGGGFGDDAWEDRQATIRRLLPTDAVRHLVLSMLDHAGLTEHGSSVLGSWLTPRGKWWLWAVEQVGGIDSLNAKFDGPGVGYPHEYDRETQTMQPCTDDCWRVPDGWDPPQDEEPPEPAVVPCPGPSCPQYLYGKAHEHTKTTP